MSPNSCQHFPLPECEISFEQVNFQANPKSYRHSSSTSSCSSISTCSSGSRSVTWSDDEDEVFPIKKITNRKEKQDCWFTKDEYKLIREEAKLVGAAAKRLRGDLEDSNEVTARGLEDRESKRIELAKEMALQEERGMYVFYSMSSVRRAQELAKKDAADAAAYQQETASEGTKSKTQRKKRFGFLSK